MRDYNISKELLFEQLDKDRSGFISQKEFVDFVAVNNMKVVEGLTTDDISKLFTFLDINGDGEISIHELASLVSGANLSLEMRMKSFSAGFEAELKYEIE